MVAHPRALRQGCAGGPSGRAAQPADPLRHRARAAAHDGHHRHVRHRLDGGDVGRAVHAGERRREDRRCTELDKVLGDRAQQPADGHPARDPDGAPQRAAGDHAAARRTSRRRGSGSSASIAAALRASGLRFFIYNLQNQRAEKLAPLLTQAFTGRAHAPAAATAPTLAPGHAARPDHQSADVPGAVDVAGARRRPRQVPTPAAALAAARAAAAGTRATAWASCATCRRSPTGTTTRS